VIYTTVSAEAAKTTPAIRATKTKTIRFFIIQSPFENGIIVGFTVSSVSAIPA
jgi:hypothetical protein